MRLEAACSADAEAIAGLHAENWRQTYASELSARYLAGAALLERRAVWKQRLNAPAPNQYVVVARTDPGVVGFACAYASHHDQWGS